MVCSEVSIQSSWTLIDVSTKDIILTHTYSVQAALTRRLPGGERAIPRSVPGHPEIALGKSSALATPVVVA